MIELTDEQMQALEAAQGPVPVVNPRTQKTFVLISQEVFELVRKLVDGPNRRGWEDPEMEDFEHLRKKK